MPEIVLTHVTKRWDKFYAVDDLNLVIDDNAFVTLLGPSGCGKTTTLRMIAGLETPTSGRITIGGRVVYDSEAGINIPPNKRKVGFLFQNYALWPNMTVYQNISFGLSNIKEELPKFDPDASRAATLLRVLQKPDDVVKTIVECVDKKGKLDVNKAQIKLIDRYEISIYAAKTLMSYKLHESMEPGTVAQARRPELEAALKSARDKAAAAGCTLNDRFEYEKDGKPVTAVRKLTPEEIDEAYEKNTGLVIIETFETRGIKPMYTPAVLCANHGPFTWGKDAAEAVHNAVVLEEVAKMARNTELINPKVKPAPDCIKEKHFYRKHGANAYYGQN